jgi:hypothetical protein
MFLFVASSSHERKSALLNQSKTAGQSVAAPRSDDQEHEQVVFQRQYKNSFLLL